MEKTLSVSPMSVIPFKWQPKYVLKRIQEADITITQKTRNEILSQLAKGGRYVQIGEYTIMLNAIKSIDPVWGAKNIPPRPEPAMSVRYEGATAVTAVSNQAELDEWDNIFAKIDDSWESK